MADDQGTRNLFGEGLPGTGGDFIDGNDTEGHRLRATDVEPDGVRRAIPSPDAGDEEDTEGHLYTGGPTTHGEFAKRVPSDNPHGER